MLLVEAVWGQPLSVFSGEGQGLWAGSEAAGKQKQRGL